MKRWVIGLVGAFVVVFVANGALVWFALNNDDPIVPSYGTEGR